MVVLLLSCLVVYIVAVIVVCCLDACLETQLAWANGRSSIVRSLVAAFLLLAVSRVGILWFLYYLKQTHQESLSMLPLVLFLYPEGMLLSKGQTLSLEIGVIGSIVLVVGSAVIAPLVAVPATLLRKLWGRAT